MANKTKKLEKQVASNYKDAMEAATRLCSLAEIATKPADMLLQDLKSGALAFADAEKSKS